MAKQILIDWQKDGILAARGVRGAKDALKLGKLSFQPAGDVPEGDRVTFKQAVQRAAEELGGGKGDVCVVASRDVVEVRTVSIPRMDAAELPDIIRFQAQRQFANISDNWLVDFILLPDAPGQEMQTALVGAMSPAQLQEIEKACASVGWNVANIAMRPLEIARFAIGSGKLRPDGPNLVVCLSDSNAELLVLHGHRVVLARGTRLTDDQATLASALGGEIRRSGMAASAWLGNESWSSVLLIATQELSQVVLADLENLAGCEVQVISPEELLSPESGSIELANKSGARLVSIAGASQLEQADKKTFLDFKNPKQPPPKKSYRSTWIIAGVTAATLLVAVIGWWTMVTRSLDQELATYRAQIASKKEAKIAAEKKIAELRDIESFLDGAPNWLDELAYLAEKIPESKQVILTAPTFTLNREGHGEMRFDALADSSETIAALGRAIRDDAHMVAASGATELPEAIDGYRWRVSETVTTKGRGWNPFANMRGAKATAPSDADSQTDGSQNNEAATEAAAEIDASEAVPEAESQDGETTTASSADEKVTLRSTEFTGGSIAAS